VIVKSLPLIFVSLPICEISKPEEVGIGSQFVLQLVIKEIEDTKVTKPKPVAVNNWILFFIL
jgi:hypothetical protein